MSRLEELQMLFEDVEEDKASIVRPLLVEIVFMEERLEALRKLPQIRVHPNNPSRQEVTAAGKQYKETMQAYLNAVKVLQSTLSRYSVEEQDAFDKWLEENS